MTAAPMASMVTFATRTLGLRKNANGTSGALERRSITTNPASRRAEATSAPTVCGELQPTPVARTSP